MLHLTIWKDGQVHGHLDLDLDDIVIGRGDDADIQLPADAVSRRHARLTRDASGWKIADLGAANGVYVGHGEDEPVRVAIEPVMAGDKIHVEHFVLCFEELSEPGRLTTSLSGESHSEAGDGAFSHKRTQFISMVEVLRGNSQSQPPAPPTAAATTTTGAPQLAKQQTWWVKLTSQSGHQRVFALEGERAQVGSSEGCSVRLPSGPSSIILLEREGPSVTLKRLGMWPFPRVHVEGRAVTEAWLSDRDAFTVGDFEVSVFLSRSP